MLKKATNSEGMIVVGGSSFKDKFLPGFSWVIGKIIYTVKEVVKKDPNLHMRRVVSSDGSVEIMEVNTIMRDLKEDDCKVLSEGEAPEEKKIVVKKVAKKKVKKKKTKKKAKKNGK